MHLIRRRLADVFCKAILRQLIPLCILNKAFACFRATRDSPDSLYWLDSNTSIDLNKSSPVPNGRTASTPKA
ncbi:hypothetical protein D3C81_1729180 [compost metagenome]